MNNLFVLHTQYHLILSLALINEKYSNDENHLILFKDFNIHKDMIIILEKIFKTVLLCTGSYNAEDLKWRKKIIRYPELNSLFKKDKTVYDNVFLVEDSVIPEQCIMRQSYKKNKNVTFGYIGDGGDAYFTNISVKQTGFSKNKLTLLIRRIVFKYILGFGRFYSDSCFGGSPLLKTCYELYPEFLREELIHKKRYEIKGEYLKTAIKQLYSYQDKPTIAKNAVFIILDKLTVYGDFELFDKVILEVVKKALSEGRTIYFKYHPAEKSTYVGASEWNEIDRNISAEYILSCADSQSVWVIGIMTTALQTAKKLGCDVTSYIESFNPQRLDVIELYKNIGIEVK